MSHEEIPFEECRKYFDLFDPVCYEPKKWVKAAKNAGIKYIVLTAKHHDGFCLFDSAYTEYKSTNTKVGRDLVKEFVDACHEEEMKVGLYFSLIDWSHPDFPKYKDRQHPMRNNEAYKDENIDFDRYLDFMHHQVREIVSNYGKLDLLWFDFSYDDLCVMILATPGQHSCNTRTHIPTTSGQAFLYYTLNFQKFYHSKYLRRSSHLCVSLRR